MTKVVFGKSKCIVDIRLEDVLRNPIWVWCLDEEGVEGQDETWQKPVIDTTDICDALADELAGTLIVFKVVSTRYYGSGSYDHRFGTIEGFWIWDGDLRPDLKDIEGLIGPVILEAVPTICGKSNVKFSCATPDAWEAHRID